MSTILDKKIDRTNSNSEKWNKYKGEDIIPLTSLIISNQKLEYP